MLNVAISMRTSILRLLVELTVVVVVVDISIVDSGVAAIVLADYIMTRS